MNIKKSPLVLTVFLLFSLLFGQTSIALPQTDRITFENLSAGKLMQGFRSKAVYINDAEQAMGGRFVHERTGFTLDLLQIQSVP